MNKYICTECKKVSVFRSIEKDLLVVCCKGETKVKHLLGDKLPAAPTPAPKPSTPTK